jgi:hypothetical protein
MYRGCLHSNPRDKLGKSVLLLWNGGALSGLSPSEKKRKEKGRDSSCTQCIAEEKAKT